MNDLLNDVPTDPYAYLNLYFDKVRNEYNYSNY